jgi:hypothetical protein
MTIEPALPKILKGILHTEKKVNITMSIQEKINQIR